MTKQLWVYVIERVGNPTLTFPIGRIEQSVLAFGTESGCLVEAKKYVGRKPWWRLIGCKNLIRQVEVQ